MTPVFSVVPLLNFRLCATCAMDCSVHLCGMPLGYIRLTNAVQMQLYFSLKLLGSVCGSSAHLSRLHVGA